MSTRIDFYILKDNQPSTRAQVACRLIEKAYQQKHQIYVHTESLEAAEYFDEFLWSFRDDSFLPHQVFYGDVITPSPTIQIGYLTTPPPITDILINLTNQAPPFYAKFERMLEIVANDENLRKAARKRYRLYQTQGCQLSSHEL
jgi:DNA polymerase-3 subunit chi